MYTNVGQHTTCNECYTNVQQGSDGYIHVQNNNCKTLQIIDGNTNIKTEEATTGGPNSTQNIKFIQIPRKGNSKLVVQKKTCCC